MNTVVGQGMRDILCQPISIIILMKVVFLGVIWTATEESLDLNDHELTTSGGTYFQKLLHQC